MGSQQMIPTSHQASTKIISKQATKKGTSEADKSALGKGTTLSWDGPKYKSLEESLKETRITGIEDMLFQCSKAVGYYKTLGFCDRYKLTKEEGVGIMLYTYENGPSMVDRNPYYLVNRALNKRENFNLYSSYIYYLLKGLRKLPVYNSAKRPLYRLQRGGVSLDEYKPDTVCAWDGFTSTSKSKRAVRSFAARNKPFDTVTSAVFEITGATTGYDISELSTRREEEEVLLEPGTRFKVLGIKLGSVVHGLPCIKVKAMESPLLYEGEVRRFAEGEAEVKRQAAERARRYLGRTAVGLSTDVLGVSVPNTWDNARMKALLDRPEITEDALVRELGEDLCPWNPRLFLELTRLTKNWAPLVAAFTKRLVTPVSEAYKESGPRPKVHQIIDYPGAPPSTMEVYNSGEQLLCGASKRVSRPPDMKMITPKFGYTTVHVFCADAVSSLFTIFLNNTGKFIGCLNSGNQSFPGGAWTRPVKPSFEENLFMCTTLSNSLGKHLYPIGGSEIVYTEDAFFFRAGESRGYAFLNKEDHFCLDVFTVPPYELVRNGVGAPFTDELALRTQAKLNLAFAQSVMRDRDILVLDALGCGEFGNPPKIVAQIFKSLITVYAGYFTDIYFPISDRKTAEEFARILVGDVNQDISAYESCTMYKWVQRNCFTSPVDLAASSPLNGPCPFGGACPMLFDGSHVGMFYHPPSCPWEGSCTLSDHLHLLLFSHK